MTKFINFVIYNFSFYKLFTVDTQDRELLDVMIKLSDGSQSSNVEDHDAPLSVQKLSGLLLPLNCVS